MGIVEIFRKCFYLKYRETILLNKNLVIADTISLFASSFFAQFYYLTVAAGSALIDSILTAAVEWTIDTPIFFALFYLDNRKFYIENDGGRLKTDIVHQLGLFGACDVMYVVIKVFLQYQLLAQIKGIQPYEASLISSLIAWGVYLIIINVTMKAARIFSRAELVWYYTLVLVIALANSIIFFSNLNLNPFLDQPVINISAASALFAAILVVTRKYMRGLLRLRGTFFLLMVGISFWFSAEMTWTYYLFVLHNPNPFPSPADALWLIGYGFLIAALYNVSVDTTKATTTLSTTRPVSRKIERNKYVMFATWGGVGLAIVLSYIYISEIQGGATTYDLSFAISVAYPLLDAIILVPTVLSIWTLRRASPEFTHWVLLGAFVILNALGDIGFAYSEIINPQVASKQEWIWDTFFNSSYLCMAAALLWYNRFSLPALIAVSP